MGTFGEFKDSDEDGTFAITLHHENGIPKDMGTHAAIDRMLNHMCKKPEDVLVATTCFEGPGQQKVFAMALMSKPDQQIDVAMFSSPDHPGYTEIFSTIENLPIYSVPAA